MEKTRNLKFLVPALLAALVLAFAGCDNGSSVEEENDAPVATETPKEAEPEAEDKKEEEDAAEEEEPAAEEEEDLGYKPPVLPASVGEDPFKGKLFINEDGEESYEFTSDGYFIHHYYEDEQDYIAEKYKYTYNATTKLLYLRLIAKICDDTETDNLYTYSEFVEYMTNHTEELGIESEDELSEKLQMYIDNFESLYISKAEASGNNLLYTEDYHTEILSFYDTETWSFYFYDIDSQSKYISLHTRYADEAEGLSEYNFGYTDSYLPNRPYLTYVDENNHEMKFQTLKITNGNPTNEIEKTYNLKYTLTLNDGVFTLTIWGADESTKESLSGYDAESNPNPTFTLKTRIKTYTFTLVTK